MKKKILIGSIIAVALLLLMPSILAIQQKSIDDGFKQEIQEKINTIGIDNSDDIVPEFYDGQYTGFLLIVGRPDVVNYNQFFGKRYVQIIVGNGNLIMLMHGAEYINPYEWLPRIGFIRGVQNVEIEDFRGLIVNRFIFGFFLGEWTAN